MSITVLEFFPFTNRHAYQIRFNKIWTDPLLFNCFQLVAGQVAAGCFYRSSRRLHDWLVANKRFGKIIRNYQERSGMTRSIR